MFILTVIWYDGHSCFPYYLLMSFGCQNSCPDGFGTLLFEAGKTKIQEVLHRDRERERGLYHYASEGCFYCRGSRRLVSQCFCRWAFLPLVRQRSRWSRAAVCLAVMQRVLVLSFNLAGIVVAPCSTPCGPTDDVKLQRDAPSPLPRPPPPI